MNFSDIARVVRMRFADDRMTGKEATELTRLVFDSITDALAEGQKVRIRGFGCFRVAPGPQDDGPAPQRRVRLGHVGRQPVVFHPSSKLQDQLQVHKGKVASRSKPPRRPSGKRVA